jgi:hypothetical protein
LGCSGGDASCNACSASVSDRIGSCLRPHAACESLVRVRSGDGEQRSIASLHFISRLRRSRGGPGHAMDRKHRSRRS